MYDTDILLSKINATRSSDTEPVTLFSLMPHSFAELRELYREELTWGELKYLNEQAQYERKKNKEEEARILSRANPQLQRAVRLGIDRVDTQRSYNALFGERAQQYVTPGSVASMFSPAGYLTELYREARDLHAADNAHHLDKRRPDLARLALSQWNMDTGVSTLSIANDIVRNNIAAREGADTDTIMEKLSTWRLSGNTPYHAPYEALRQTILLQDPTLEALSDNPDIGQQVDVHSLLAILGDVSPELYAIFTETVTAENAAELYKKNFGDIETKNLLNIYQLAYYYDIPQDELITLSNLISQRDYSQPVQYYTNGVLTTLVTTGQKSEGAGEIVQIVSRGLTNQLNYLELLPQGWNNYLLNFSFNYELPNNKLLKIGTTGGNASDLYSGELIPLANEHISIPITLSEDKVQNGVTIGISRFNTEANNYYFAYAEFTKTTLSPEQYLLAVNKIFRLYKACHLTAEQMYLLLYNQTGRELFDTRILGTAFLSQFYMQRYHLGTEDAIVLAGGNISAVIFSGQPKSYFDTLFNSPALNNRVFIADGAAVSWDTTNPNDIFRLSAIARAFRVSPADLKALWQLAAGRDTTFTTTAENLALLYRTVLLAEVHHLTPAELVMLLSLSPWSGTALSAPDAGGIATLVNYVYSAARRLKAEGVSAGELYLMLTPRYSTLLTPDIENLITTLRSAVSPQDMASDSLIATLAPYISAAGQLNSSGTAESVLRWLDALKPGGTDVKTFIALVLKDNRTGEETARLVAFCQVLGQLTLLVRRAGVSDYLLSLLVSRPELLQGGDTVLPHTLDALQLISRVNRRIRQTGGYAGQLLVALDKGELTAELLAQALPADSVQVKQALALADSSAGDTVTSLKTLDVLLQWLDLSAALHCPVAATAALIKLKYINISADSAPAYDDWLAVSNLLQGGLSPSQNEELQASLGERESAALSSYFIQTAGLSQVTNRETLYSWLLIDGQVSSRVTTTRLGEAISSIQLYVNRCRNNLEPGIKRPVLTRQFFTDWDTYNRRYSTWAGVSQLVYYPENYVDPTVRTGQTSMMDAMLQEIGQSELSSDTVADAFRTYMTRFEKIANLDVISAYHDNVAVGEGKTWFIGKSTIEGEKYYWRSLRQNMLNEGKYPATAWSEWTEIGTAIAAWNNLVRPVIFNDRLYVVWLTEKPVAANNNGTVTESSDYFISFSYIRHDGTWSTPLNGKLSDYIGNAVKQLPGKRFYCTSNNDSSAPEIAVIFYTPGATEAANQNQTVTGLSISREHEFTRLADASFYHGYLWPQYDLQNEHRVNFLFVEGAFSCSLGSLSADWGEQYLSLMSGGNYSINSITLNQEGTAVDVNLNAILKYSFRGMDSGDFGSNRRISIDLLKEYTDIGASAIIFTTASYYNASPESPRFNMLYVTSETAHRYPCGMLKVDRIISASKRRAAFLNKDGLMERYFELISLQSDGTHLFTGDAFVFRTTNGAADVTSQCYIWDMTLPDRQICANPFTYTTEVRPENIYFELSHEGTMLKQFTGLDIPRGDRPTPDWDTTYNFSNLDFSVPLTLFHASKAEIRIRLAAYTTMNHSLGEQIATFTLYQNTDPRKMSIARTDTGAQYLQRGSYRIRINTLFAHQLVARANLGLDAVLSMETQQLPEPKLGAGNYISLTLDRYEPDRQGEDWYKVYLVGVISNDSQGSRSTELIASGRLSANEQTKVKFFLPYNADKTGDEAGMAYIAVNYASHTATGSYKTMEAFTWDKGRNTYQKTVSGYTNWYVTSSVLTDDTEPMDFTGANALYFWEMFYYVPSLVFQRLLQESKFDEATKWMKYIWDPSGYFDNSGEPTPWLWNVRPLEEDTSWNPDPLDSVDPDAVAQSDPMHYKVATFMRVLDLLIARGDAAYRLAERDTLNEAKMWYVSALDLLGDEPYDSLLQGGWGDPVLAEAASQTKARDYQQQLSLVRNRKVTADTPRTASSLVAIFYPEFNAKLTGYWRTLRQRLYNLRHNLSIDGQPLYLPVYAAAASPEALLSAAAVAAGGGAALPVVPLPQLRFPLLLESARSLVSQLIQFGNTMLSITERQDAEALSVLLQNQGLDLLSQNMTIQDKLIAELDADRRALLVSRKGSEQRMNSYKTLYDENVNTGEARVMQMYFDASVTGSVSSGLQMGAAALNMVPNIYGLAVGGGEYGALLQAMAIGVQVAADGIRISADKIAQSEVYRRRRQEWEIQRNNAAAETEQIDAQIKSTEVRREAAVLQKTQAEMQLNQTRAQLEYLQGKFTGQALYSWLRGTLSAIYYQFYDVAVTRCMQAQRAWQWNFNDEVTTFIRPGAWQGAWLGFMAGETLMLSLAGMEQAWLDKDIRMLEVSRTVSLAEVYRGLTENPFSLAEQVAALVNSGSGSAGSGGNTLQVNGEQLQASIRLADLNIQGDYTESLGTVRRIRQISVTLSALVVPYQDVRAVLSYGGSVVLPQGGNAVAISHGMNDSGQFQLDFNDSRWLPFEGIPVNDTGTLTLNFEGATDRQKALLLSLTDIIFHIRYTISH